jgi:hypothetical protein
MRRLPLAAFVFEARELLLQARNLPLEGGLFAFGTPELTREVFDAAEQELEHSRVKPG